MGRAGATTGWIIDLDGCLVRAMGGGGVGGAAMPRAAEFLEEIQRRGEPYVVCTNASERPPEEYARNLRGLGIPVADAHFATAGSVAADYLAKHHRGEPVIGIGSAGFLKTLDDRGVVLAGRDSWQETAAVVIGAAEQYDISWMGAGALAAEAGATLYTCTVHPWLHGGIAKSVASSAIIAAGVGWAAGVDPVVLGKPSRALGLTLAERMRVDPRDVIVVGDSIVEVALARELGGSSYLVLSGATSAEQAQAIPPDERPLGVFADIAALHVHLATSARLRDDRQVRP